MTASASRIVGLAAASVAALACAKILGFEEHTVSEGAGNGGVSGAASGSAGASQGGTSASGGSNGSGGSGDTGGDAGDGQGGGGAVGGSSGTGATGGTPSGGTSGQSTGGASGKGGSSGAVGGAGGSAGKGTGGAMAGAAGIAGSGGGSLDPGVIVPDFDGYLWEATCVGTRTVSGTNCPLDDVAACPSGATWDTRGTIRNDTIQVNGAAGVQYTINIAVRGVVGTRCYTGGVAASTAMPSATGPNNTWYSGGRQAGDSTWNTYELHVENALVSGEANVYFLNAFPASPTDWCQKEATYEVNYTASFKVMGDSTLRLTLHDSNCSAQQNCGSTEAQTSCTSPRTVSLAGLSPQPPTSFTQPPANVVSTATYHPQWLYIDVTSITSP